MKALRICDLKPNQLVYDYEGSYRVYSPPVLVNGIWEVETTSDGDYVVTFREPAKLFSGPILDE